MKRLGLIVLLLWGTIRAADDTLSVVVYGDSAEIHNTRIYEHCAFNPLISVTVNDSVITIVESDTMKDWTTCLCYKDLCVSVGGLQSGHYRADVFRRYEVFMPDSLYWIGSVWFDIAASSSADLAFSVKTTDCYDITAMPETDQPATGLVLKAYPNPFNQQVRFEYTLAHGGDVSLRIYDLHGRLIAQLHPGSQSSGHYSVLYDAAHLASGLYFCRLSIDNSPQTGIKVVVLK